MNKLRNIAIVLLLIYCWLPTQAQEQLGLKLGNYTGVNSVFLNPASSVNSPFQWDANIISFGGFFDNNYAYLENASVLNFLRWEDIYSRPAVIKEDIIMSPNPIMLDYFNDDRNKWVSGQTTITGPAFMFKIGPDWTIGAFTQLRIVGEIRDIPKSLGYYNFDGALTYKNVGATAFRGAAMAWLELGVNVSKQMETDYGTLSLGVNLKNLNGIDGAFGTVPNTFVVAKELNDTISIQYAKADFAFTTTNADIVNTRTVTYERNGGGIGLDIGAEFLIEGAPDKYQWKLGASLLDLGRVRFSKNAQSHSLAPVRPFRIITANYESLRHPEEVAQMLSLEALGDSLASYQDDNFGIWLPTALSLQADYAITNELYINAALIQSVPMGDAGLRRDNLLALSPRFENRWFGAMIPVSVLNYEQVHIGFAARLAYLTIGTDNLMSFIGEEKLTGSDIYLSLKVNPFYPENSSGHSRRRRGKNVKCYKF